MKIELCGVDVDVISNIHKAMPKSAECIHNPGHGTIFIDDRVFKEKDIGKAVHYLLSL